MNYLEAKMQLQKKAPQIPFNLMAIEATAMVAIAAGLVYLF